METLMHAGRDSGTHLSPAFSRGAKGLCYGKRLGGLSEEATRELAEVTRQVASIRDYLVFSEPMNWARTSRSTVEAAALLAGEPVPSCCCSSTIRSGTSTMITCCGRNLSGMSRWR